MSVDTDEEGVAAAAGDDRFGRVFLFEIGGVGVVDDVAPAPLMLVVGKPLTRRDEENADLGPAGETPAAEDGARCLW